MQLECRIDGHDTGLVPIAWLGVSPDGVTIAVLQPQDASVRFFDSTCNPVGSFGRSGRGPGEFEAPRRGGWRGDTLWISDVDLNRVTLISPGLEFKRSLEHSVLARPKPEDSKRFPTYSLAVPYALYTGDTLLVQGLIPTSEPEEGFDGPQLFRSLPAGVLDRHVITIPRALGDRVELGAVPFTARPEWAVAPDGARIATVTFVNPGPDTQPAIRVTSYDSNGAVIYDRVLPAELSAIQDAVADSVVEARARSHLGGPASPAQMRELREAIPENYPPADAIVVGQDYRVWIGLHSSAEVKPWLVLSPAGELLGRIELPSRSRIVATSSSHVFAIEKDDLDVESVAVYAYDLREATSR